MLAKMLMEGFTIAKGNLKDIGQHALEMKMQRDALVVEKEKERDAHDVEMNHLLSVLQTLEPKHVIVSGTGCFYDGKYKRLERKGTDGSYCYKMGSMLIIEKIGRQWLLRKSYNTQMPHFIAQELDGNPFVPPTKGWEPQIKGFDGKRIVLEYGYSQHSD